MKGERQMIYKNITFKADPFSYDLEFDDRITLVGGDSGSGKTVLYEMLEDIRLIDEYKAISPVFEQDIYDAISLKTCVEKRLTLGAPGPDVMKQVIEKYEEYLLND